MRHAITKPSFPLFILAASIVISTLAYLFYHPKVEGRLFFYPDTTGTYISVERRGIPQRSSLEAKIAVFLEELALGPFRLDLSQAMPRETDILHVAVIDKTAYVNIDRTILKSRAIVPIDFDEALENIRYNILFNFQAIKEVVFSIEGQQVYTPYYQAPGNSE